MVNGTVQVAGTAVDATLDSWVLQYTVGDAHAWMTISSGAGPVINNVLGTWNNGARHRNGSKHGLCSHNVCYVALLES